MHKRVSLFGTTAMTPIERREGRFLRAPDHDDGFEIGAGFVAATAGDDDAGKGAAGKEPVEKKPVEGEEKPGGDGDAGDDDKGGEEDDAGEGDAGDDDKGGEEDDAGEGGEDENKGKKRKPASERIRELNRRLRDSERAREADRKAFEARMEKIEKGLPANSGGDTNGGEAKAPDPTDTEKYPLGILDDRYIEDKIEFVATQKATKAVDGILQREQETTQQRQLETEMTRLRETADDLASKGSELFDDYEETVVQAGLRGDYKLTQATFEAAAEDPHGAEILYSLASDKAEAARVAALPVHQQVKFVLEKSAEITGRVKPRHKPGAGDPPKNSPRGGNAKTHINPSTDNLDDFEKLYAKK